VLPFGEVSSAVRSGDGKRLGAIVAAALALAPGMARAQGSSCRISGVTSPAFGTYDPFATTPLDAVGSITHSCPKTRPVQILLDSGASASFTPRAMVSGTGQLAYNLYLDPPSTPGARIWGDGSGGTYIYSGAGKVTVPLYGRVFAQQDVAAGAYSDTVTITFLF
jgi:spore coat protein U-like protein